MFTKVLVANRGEIAVRIIRSCRELGISTVAVFSTADRDALHVRLADQSVCIGPAPAPGSYLHIPNIVQAALNAGCDAVHPGTGFLAEDTYFAEICDRCRLTFVGPPADVIEHMSDKAFARRAMAEAGLPVLPGSVEPLRGLDDARDLAATIGYPVMLKAAAGGGGRGIRFVPDDTELAKAYTVTEAEAGAASNTGRLYLEKFLQEARHVEVQVLGDRAGNVVHLGDRDCSVQRRHQKLVEEAPAAALPLALRDQISAAAVDGTRAVGYQNAGTMEFLVGQDHQFYFLELNTRLQVEHTVTEALTGIDLVKQQLRIAAGEPLPWTQNQITMSGHAIECRINAEDPEHGFAPASGVITAYLPPGGQGIRVDSHLYTGYSTPPYYDSLLAKIIAWGRDREEARRRMRRALSECIIEGLSTTVAFQQRVIDHPCFVRNDVSLSFVERNLSG